MVAGRRSYVECTRVVGYERLHDARMQLAEAYRALLVRLGRLPADYCYRIAMCELCTARLGVIGDAGKSDEAVARELGTAGGVVEELVEQANEEMVLVDELVSWRAWEG